MKKNHKYLIETDDTGQIKKLSEPVSEKKEASLREAELTSFFNQLLLNERNKNASLKHDNHLLKLQLEYSEAVIAEMKNLIVYAMHNSKKTIAKTIFAKKEEIKELIKHKEHDLEQAYKMPAIKFDNSEQVTFENHNKVISEDDK